MRGPSFGGQQPFVVALDGCVVAEPVHSSEVEQLQVELFCGWKTLAFLVNLLDQLVVSDATLFIKLGDDLPTVLKITVSRLERQRWRDPILGQLGRVLGGSESELSDTHSLKHLHGLVTALLTVKRHPHEATEAFTSEGL